jgi:hypothetical protein
VQHRDPVAHLLDLGEQVAGEEHRGAAIGQRAEQGPELADTGGVHAIGRLVQQQQRWVAQQRDREPETLTHVLRVRLDLAAGDRGQPDPVQRVVDRVRMRQRRPAQCEHLQIAPPAQPWVEGRLLDHRPNPGQPLGVRQRPAIEPGSARRRPDQPEQHAHGGGLPRPVRAEEAEDLPGFDRQVEPVDCDRGSVPLGQALTADGLCHPASPH